MSKFSVKRPFIVLVAVLALCVLGVAGFTRMGTDLLPEMNLPYMAVITTYPGASPQKVEQELTNPIEDSVSTINGIRNVTSVSMENASQITLEFENGTNMDSAMVKVTSAINQLELPDTAGKPIAIEASMNMLPILYVGVDKEGLEGTELATFIKDEVVPELKRQDGVASVQTQGLIEDSVEVRINQAKVDQVNGRIRAITEAKLDEAKEDLDSAQGALNSAKNDLSKQKKKLEKQQKKSSDEMAEFTKQMNTALATKAAYESQYNSLTAYSAALKAEQAQYLQYDPTNARVAEIDSELKNLETETAAAKAALDAAGKQIDEALKNYDKVEAGKITAAAAFGAGSAQISSAEETIAKSQEELDSGYDSYEKGRKKALKNANANALLDLETLSGIISAQNFSMPVGYISDDKTQYLLRIDEETTSKKAVSNLILMNMDEVGDIKLSDVADIQYIDNSDETYARLNGEEAAIIALFKTSSASTTGVSRDIGDAMERLEKRNKGLRFTNLMDQGEYIDFIINHVFSNLIWGAVLAILVLLLFLRDLRPTAVVAISIPLSVLFAVLAMYFTDMTFNMLSLSGLALGIGMLVDNSIVVMENIYRLKSRGESAPRAAVMGANQVGAAITASTLTTICVFLPVLFTDGLTRELITDLCLAITFSLVASLVVALTVVPATSATLLKKAKPRTHSITGRLSGRYEGALAFCLRHKALPLLVAVALLGFCGAMVFRTGVVMIPDISTNQLSVNMTLNQESDKDADFATIDRISEKIQKIEGVERVGSIQSATLLSTGGSAASKNFSTMILIDDDHITDYKKIQKKVKEILDKERLEDYQVSGSENMTAMLGSGLQVDIYGEDEQKLLEVSHDVMDMVEELGGFEDISNGQEDAVKEIVLDIDKVQAMRRGLTVAQIYQALSEKLTTDKKATEITVDDEIIDVKIVDEREEINKDDLLGTKISGTEIKADGSQAKKNYKLSDFARMRVRDSVASITHDDGARLISVTAMAAEGENVTLLSRELEKKFDSYDLPRGYKLDFGGETESVNKMLKDMGLMMLVSLILIYLIMVAQFANFLSPFIVMFTIPLAFTGGFLALMIAGQELSMLSILGFLILAGVVVNNGIVFIDYTNRLRRDGMEKREALIRTGKDRMRPILMTALTTILAMSVLAVRTGQGAELGRGMAVVAIGGLAYATLMTLFIVPVMYDIFYRKEIKAVDLGDESTLKAEEGHEI